MRQEPEATHQLESAYYGDRKMAIVYFFVNAVLMIISSYSLLNALQHPELSQDFLAYLHERFGKNGAKIAKMVKEA